MTRRADRLFALMQALSGGRLRRAEDLAAMLEVSARTIYRDIADLQAHGAPIDGERGVGYQLRAGHFLPPLSLTKLELEALRWGVAFTRAHGDDALASAAEELRVKIESALKRALPDVAAATAYGARLTDAQRETLRAAREAITARRKLRLSYRDADGAASMRVLRPLELEHWGAVWTLTGWCELRDDFRVFRLDRIEACEALEARFRDEAGKRMADFITQMEALKNSSQPSDHTASS